MKRVESIRAQRGARTRTAEPDIQSRGKDQYYSRAVAKALRTLEVLQTARTPLALHEVAQRIQLSKTSSFRLLRTLEVCGCLTASEGGRYALAPGVT